MANGSTEGQSSDGGNRGAIVNATKVLSLIATALQAAFPQVTGTAATATGGAATLPANPVGYVTIVLPDGTTALIPYYAP